MQIFLNGESIIAKILAIIFLKNNNKFNNINFNLVWDFTVLKKEQSKQSMPRIVALSPFSFSFLQNILGDDFANIFSQNVMQMHLYTKNNSYIIDKNKAQKPALAFIINTVELHQALDRNLNNLNNLKKYENNLKKLDVLNIYTQKPTENFINLHKLELTQNIYQQTAYTANLICTQSQPYAHQWFIDGEIIALLPIKKNAYALVLSTSKNYKNSIEILEKIKNLPQIYKFGVFMDIQETGKFPLQSHYLANIWMHENNNYKLFMGDCAHQVHPLAGQGLNIALRNLADFADILEKNINKKQFLLKNILENYQITQNFRTYSRYLAINNIYHFQQSKLNKLNDFIFSSLKLPFAQKYACAFMD